jgi:hypothetical protein
VFNSYPFKKSLLSKQDALLKVNNEVEKSLKVNKDYIENLTQKPICKMKISNPELPNFHGVPKAHKNNMPVRPIIASFNSPQRKLEEWLQSLLKQLSLRNNFTVKNGKEFIDRVRNINIRSNYRLISFDVSSLFTNIPKPELLLALQDSLLFNDFSEEDSKIITSLVKMCISQNLFLFNNEVYELTNGLPMGSPISPALADIFMDYLESKLIDTPEFQEFIVSYSRYMDDIWCISKGNDMDNEHILNILNGLFPTIKFTYEMEKDRTLPFLDVKISREDNLLKFGIFKKETSGCSIIPSFSNHTFQHKMGFFRFSFNRILNYLSTVDEQHSEKQKIIDIGINNGYSKKCLENLYMKMEMQHLRNNSFTLQPMEKKKKEKKKNLIFTKTRFMNPSYKKLLRSHNLQIVEKPGPKLNSFFNKHKKLNHREDILSSGIYKIQCSDCPKFYIGQTCRSIQTRASEHLDAVNMGGRLYRKNWSDICNNPKNQLNGFTKHIIDDGHSSEWSQVEVIKKVPSHTLDLEETFYISEEDRVNLMNISKGPLFGTPTFELYSQLKRSSHIL